MNKKEIKLKRVTYDGFKTLGDVVAVELTINIEEIDGTVKRVTCSPGHLEEMVLGRRATSGRYVQEIDGEAISEIRVADLLDLAKQTIGTPAELFNSTGCAHSCMLVKNNEIICHMEDIKRHNALDKAVGHAVKYDIPLNSVILFTSGRVSLDYIEKAVNAGIRIIASRAAVTDAAIEYAKEKDITLLGFVREGRANLYNEGKVKLIQEEQ